MTLQVKLVARSVQFTTIAAALFGGGSFRRSLMIFLRQSPTAQKYPTIQSESFLYCSPSRTPDDVERLHAVFVLKQARAHIMAVN